MNRIVFGMTITIVIFTSAAVVFLLAIRGAFKHRNKGESKLSVYEHSSSFKKPDKEMVNDVTQHQYDSDKTVDISSTQIKDDKKSTDE